jgi:polyferredoxin
MSLNSLASSRVARDLAAKGRKPPSSRATDDAGLGAEDVQNALSALIEYVPAETITLYLAVISALPALQSFVTRLSLPAVYWGFVVITPVLFAVIYAGKRRAQGESRSPGLRNWPWWPMIAATIAFMAWALAAPSRPYFAGDVGGTVVGLLAIITSTLLGVAARFFGSPPGD